MSKFQNVELKNITVWWDYLTQRITAKAVIDGEWHEVAFREGFHGTMQDMVDALKEDLREQP